MTVRGFSEHARRRAEEADRVGRTYGDENAVFEDDSETSRLYREAPTADELTPDLFLEEALAAPESQVAGAAPDAFSQMHSEDALDLLMQQAQQDAGSGIGYGERAGMAMADADFARNQGGPGLDPTGGGAAIQNDLAGIGAANDHLLNNYAGNFNMGQAQETGAMRGLGGAASGLRDQSFGEQFRRGAAVDAFNQANLSYGRGVNERNTDRTNRHSAEGEAAHQQVEDNEYGLHQGTTAIRQADKAIDRAEDQREEDESMAGWNATVGTVKGILG